MIRYSSRIDFGAAPNALSKLLDEKRAAGVTLLDLTESNPTRVGLAYPGERIRAALSDERSLLYEPDPQGGIEARRAIATSETDLGRPTRAEDLILTASTSEAYAWLFKLLCEPGQAVLVPRPSYPLFDFLAGLEAVRVVPYPLLYDGEWHVDFAALQQAVARDPDIRAIVVVEPNNPTGSFLKRAETLELEAIAIRHQLPLIIDAVFADYELERQRPGEPRGPSEELLQCNAPDAAPDTEGKVLRFKLGGLSKGLLLPQLKLGYIHVTGPEDERSAALSRLELIADTYLSISAPVQWALPTLLEMKQEIVAPLRARLGENLAVLRAAVLGTACQVLRVEGGWYAIVRVPETRSDEDWALTLIADDDVVVQPGYFYDFLRGAYLVLSLLPKPEIVAEGMRRLVARVAALS